MYARDNIINYVNNVNLYDKTTDFRLNPMIIYNY